MFDWIFEEEVTGTIRINLTPDVHGKIITVVLYEIYAIIAQEEKPIFGRFLAKVSADYIKKLDAAHIIKETVEASQNPGCSSVLAIEIKCWKRAWDKIRKLRFVSEAYEAV